MKAPPGCPLRQVEAIQHIDGGAFLKLACGHSIWEGGFPQRRPQGAVFRWCLTGPCYKHQKPMGIHC